MLSLALKCLLLGLAIADRALADSPTPDFGREVRPILADKCFVCHGPDSGTREAGLRLDLSADSTKLLDSGSIAIVPGKPAESELVARIESHDEALRMPPADSGKTLTSDQKSILKRWIQAGAKYDQHWAFVAPIRPAVPTLKDSSWVRNPIDSFVLSKLEANGLEPSKSAAKEDLVRRLYLDLTGLPPSIEESDAFVNDTDPSAIQKLFTQLISSPHYGERMAIEWLDGARFADSNGYQNDFARSMWPWRDWVINAYNGHMRYDQFVTEQLAGDLLSNPTLAQRIATGFNRNNRTVTEAGSIEDEWHVENVVDRVETTGSVFLGLTIGCARCHDHKFDPISQKEFYQFYSFFNNVNEKGVYTEQRGNVAPLVKVADEVQSRQLASLQHDVSERKDRLSRLMEQLPARRDQWLAALKSEVAVTEPEPVFTIPLAEDWDLRSNATGRLVTAAGVEPRPKRESDFAGIDAQFSGSERLAYSNVVHFEKRRPYSIAFWVKPGKTGAVVSQLDTSASFRGNDVFVLNDRKLAVHLIHEWPENAIKVISKEPLREGQWSHVVVRYNGSGRAAGVGICINGKLQEQTVDVDNLEGEFATDKPFFVGSRSADAYFSGSVRDVRVYDRELADDEVAAVAQGAVRRTAGAIDLGGLSAEQLTSFDQWMLTFSHDEIVSSVASVRSDLQHSERAVEKLEKQIPTSMVMEELDKPRQAYVLKRGAYDAPDKTQPVSMSVPSFLPPLPAGAPANRLGLARWITAPNHPLTARVAVNREWQRFFGTGLVRTSDNFGLQSEPPSHPELLDWLATEFIESNWNLQHIQELIVTSATYGQSSRVSPDRYAQDPENRLLARGPRFRLKAELVRDNALAISGLLTSRVGGPSAMPYQPDGLWAELQGGAFEVYTQDHSENLYRRSLYTYRKRTVPHPTLATFDAPSWEICQVKRSLTNTPLQSLATLNDVTYVEAARKFAERILRSGSGSRDRLTFAFRMATGRHPNSNELDLLDASLTKYLQTFKENPDDAKQLLTHGESPRDESLDTIELAAHTAVAGVLLNLDDTITRN
jgi:hypothetical protein